ncbi:hypothetical protein [Rhizobium lusitanum]|uniref:Uncharacterized protein n=1 Tax=Rhizobium lusitanum TaxID=293958 RepID=A0A1C3USA7_9HYPH|nr:hypothetical protein [Rhizobium lusitanum]SCB18217.1 hypothetical protein GA0061101_103234 [Rhizobium lusitanum]
MAYIDSIEPTPRRQSLGSLVPAKASAFPLIFARGMVVVPAGDVALLTDICLADLPEWWELRGLCSRCRHNAALSRRWLSRRDVHTPLAQWRRYLRCTKCNNKERNEFVARKIPRD